MDYYVYNNSFIRVYISGLYFRYISITFLDLAVIVGSSSVTQLNPM